MREAKGNPSSNSGLPCPFCDRPADDRCRFCVELQAAEAVYCPPGPIPINTVAQIYFRHRPLTEAQAAALGERFERGAIRKSRVVPDER
jgi:hypothetical protein